MQQTENYKLNLIETSDPFSPGALNENARKTEAALLEAAAEHAALEQRMITLENCRIVIGRYIGTNQEMIIDLGERPAAVLVSYFASHTGYTGLAVGDVICMGPHDHALRLVDNGFWVSDIFTKEYSSKMGYCYMALLGDWPKNDTVTKET